jgi:signal transduction histidine kinase
MSSSLTTYDILQQFLNHIPLAICILNNNKQITWANNTYLDIFNYQLDDIVQTAIVEFIIDNDIKNKLIELISLHSDYSSINVKMIKKDKSLINVSLYGNFISNDNHLIYARTLIDNNTTEFYNFTHIPLNFTNTVSKDIKTYLTGIISVIEILKTNTQLTKEQSEYISIIYQCGYQLVDIINNILDYSRVITKSISLHLEPLNIRDEIAICYDIFQLKASESNIEYYCNVHPDVPIHIEGDKKIFKQILTNIISN